MESDGDRDMEAFAKRVGRSTRQLRGLERGEPVGPKTLELVAVALGISPWYVFSLLSDPDFRGREPVTADAIAAKARRDSELGEQPTSLSAYNDDELLAEIRRRMREGGSNADAAPRKKSPDMARLRAAAEAAWIVEPTSSPSDASVTPLHPTPPASVTTRAARRRSTPRIPTPDLDAQTMAGEEDQDPES